MSSENATEKLVIYRPNISITGCRPTCISITFQWDSRPTSPYYWHIWYKLFVNVDGWNIRF